MTEKELITACKKGDMFAQKLLFNQYWEKVFGVCIRYVKHQEIAEEMMSDTFLKGLKSVRQFEYRGEGSVRAWLCKIAVNECLMFLRREKKMNFVELSSEQIENVQEDSGRIAEQLSAKELMHIIQELPAGYRTVFNLYVMENCSHKEIATFLGISENTSKSQLKKARLALQEKIKNYGK